MLELGACRLVLAPENQVGVHDNGEPRRNHLASSATDSRQEQVYSYI